MQVACVSTFPPRECGIATFAQDLTGAIDSLQQLPPIQVVAISKRGISYDYPPQVCYELVQEERGSYLTTASFLNHSQIDLVLIQHEFGIYGGTDGSYLLTLLAALEKPVITTFHTIQVQPPTRQRSLLQEIAAQSSLVITPAEKGRELLVRQYKISPSKIRVIPHGVPQPKTSSVQALRAKYDYQDQVMLCTFGLLHPGKGLEYVINALPALLERHPEAVYLILGETHPEVKRLEGEAYRNYLERLVSELHLEQNVIFVNRYLTKEELLEYLQMADIYLTPYISEDQICSGTLAYAVSVGKAVVSTPYLYAQELLADNRGCLVPFRDSAAISKALNHLLDQPGEREKLQARAREFGQQMIWPLVAQQYVAAVQEVGRLIASSPNTGVDKVMSKDH